MNGRLMFELGDHLDWPVQLEVKIKREVGLAYRASTPLADALKDLVGKLQGRRARNGKSGRRRD